MAVLKTFVHEFRQGNDGSYYDNGWWEYHDNDIVYNVNGGRHDYTHTPQEEFKESTWDDIIKEEFLAHINEYSTGWLAPDGKFYGCDYMDHRRFAEYVFDEYEYDLEKKGYCKIYRDPLEYGKLGFDHMPGNKRLTEAQWKYLLDEGYTDPEEYDLWS